MLRIYYDINKILARLDYDFITIVLRICFDLTQSLFWFDYVFLFSLFILHDAYYAVIAISLKVITILLQRYYNDTTCTLLQCYMILCWF